MKTINFHRNGFEVKFYNPISSKLEYIGRYVEESEAIKNFVSYETNFYSNNKILLPKSINVVKDIGFTITITVNNYNKHKTVHLGYFKTMDEAKQGKLDIIAKFI